MSSDNHSLEEAFRTLQQVYDDYMFPINEFVEKRTLFIRVYTNISEAIKIMHTTIQEASQYNPTHVEWYESKLEAYRESFGKWVDAFIMTFYQHVEHIYDPATETIKTNLGRVELRRHRELTVTHAIKYSQIRESAHEDPIREAWFCAICSKDWHAGMLSIYSCMTLPREFIAITPYAQGGDLYRYLTLKKDEAKVRAKEVFEKICYNIDYLHNHLGVAHLDLKPENVFLNANYDPVLADFGMSRIGDYPSIEHNTKQGYIFQDASHITEQITQCILMNIIDEACDAFPPFSINLEHLEKSQQKYGQIEGDLFAYVDRISFRDDYVLDLTLADYREQQRQSHNLSQEAMESLTARDMIQSVLQMLITKYPNHQETDIKRVIICSIIPGTEPRIYSRLCPDRSYLALRPCTSSVGTRAYMAPEILNPPNGRPSYDPFKADIYSLGVILFILLFQFPPYKDPSTNDPAYSRLHSYQSRDRTAVEKLIAAYGRRAHPSVVSLLDRMMVFEPRNRYNIKRIIAMLPDLVFETS